MPKVKAEKPKGHLTSEEATEVQAQYLNLITAVVEEGILIVDATGIVTAANPAFLKKTGFEEAEVIGQTCHAVLGLRDENQNLICDTNCPASSRGKVQIKGTISTAGGSAENVNINSLSATLGDGSFKGRIILIHWDSDKLYPELDAAQLSNITHEFQTPISIIKAFASTLTLPGVTWSETTIKDKLTKIEMESDRLSAMVSTLMGVFRADSGKTRLNLMQVSLKDTIDRILQRFAGNWDRDFQNMIPEDIPTVQADPEKLETIFNNLVGNAIKFSSPGSMIRLSASTGNNEVLITISDNGIGIAAEDHERIFERFYRVERGNEKKRSGVGLGLSICKSLIESQGGRIRVASKIGQGASFTFSLPVAKSE